MKKLSNIFLILALTLLSIAVIDQFDIGGSEKQTRITKPGTTEIQTITKVKTKDSYKEHIEKGDKRLALGYHTLAISQYSEAVKEEPTLAEPYIKIGDVHFKEKNYAKAIENYRIGGQIEPNSLIPKIKIGKTYIQESDFENADKIFNALNSEDAIISYYRGLLNIAYKNFEDAKFNLEAVIQKTSASDSTLEDTKLALNSAQILAAFETYEQSEGAQETYLLTLLAKALSQVKEDTIAIEVIYTVLETNPDYRDAWIILGYSYLQIEKYFDAISSLKEAEAIDPTKAETLYFLGIAEKKQGQLIDAINHLEAAKDNGFEPELSLIEELASAYLEAEDFNKAATYYEKLVDLDATNIDAFVKAIWIYIDIVGRVDKALELAETVVANNPDVAQSYNLLGWAQIQNGEYEPAKENLDKALSIDPNLAAAYLNLGLLHEAEEKYELALEFYKKAYEIERTTGVGEKAYNFYTNLLEKEADEIIENENINNENGTTTDI